MGSPVTFAGSASDLRLGPASITYNGRNLGYTLNDSVSIQLEQTSTEIQPDQASLPLKDIITGMTLTISMTLGEVTKENISMIPGFDGAGKLTDPIGIDMLAVAKELIVFPLSSADENMYIFPKASPMMTGPMQFARETPQGLELTFKAYVDSSDMAMEIAAKTGV